MKRNISVECTTIATGGNSLSSDKPSTTAINKITVKQNVLQWTVWRR